MAYIKERITKNGNTHYRATIRLKGYPTQSATFERKTDAKRWVTETEAKLRSKRYFKVADAEKNTLSDTIRKYLETSAPIRYTSIPALRTVKHHLKWWEAEFGKYLLTHITPSMVSQGRDKLLNEDLKDGYGNIKEGVKHTPANVVRYMASLSAMFTTIVNEWEWLESNPVKKVKRPKEPRGRVRFLSRDERGRLLNACEKSSNPYLFPIVVIAISTGARLNEIKTLKWENVDFERNIIRLEDTKNNERRAIPLVHKAKDLLERLHKNKRADTELLFPRPDGLKPVATEIQWRQALSEAEIEEFCFHDLRHTAASYLAMNGATLAEIAAVLGHKTLAMVKRYAHLTEQHTVKVVEKMNKSIF